MAAVVNPGDRPELRRIRGSGWLAFICGMLFVPVLGGFLLVRALICQGNETNLGNLMWVCPLLNALVPLLAIAIPAALAIILLQLYSLGAGAEQPVRARYEARRAARLAQPRPAALQLAIETYHGLAQNLAEANARVGSGRSQLDPAHLRHYRWTQIALAIVAAAWLVLWWQWGVRATLGFAPRIDSSVTFRPPPLPESGPATGSSERPGR
jgi:hypothetical protein